MESGFRFVAQWLEEAGGPPRDESFGFMWGEFMQGGRGDTFDRLLEQYQSRFEPSDVAELVRVYREHPPDIRPLPGIPELLGELLEGGLRLGILSDGFVPSQQRKLQALGLEQCFDPLVFTDSWGKAFWKPHPRGFQHIAEQWGLDPVDLTYISDNPQKDFLGPKRLGWRTIRLRVGGQLHRDTAPPTPAHEATHVVDDLERLKQMLVGPA